MIARKPLDVWLYGTQVATIADHGPEIRLQWSHDAALTTLDHSRYPGVPEAAFNVVEERTRGLIGQLT